MFDYIDEDDIDIEATDDGCFIAIDTKNGTNAQGLTPDEAADNLNEENALFFEDCCFDSF